MKKILSTSESIDPRQEGTLLREVHATGDADYDERRKCLRLKLDCYLRESRWGRKDRIRHVDWLPHQETLHEAMPVDDALPAARSIFHDWTGRIRRSIVEHQAAEAAEPALA